MILTHLELMDSLKAYASPKARLTRLLKIGALVQLRRGLFVDDTAISIFPLPYIPMEF